MINQKDTARPVTQCRGYDSDISPASKAMVAALKTPAQHYYDQINAALMQAAFDRPVALTAIAVADGVCRILTTLQWEYDCKITHVGDYVNGVNRKFDFKIGNSTTREHIKMTLIVGSTAEECVTTFKHKTYTRVVELMDNGRVAEAFIKIAMDGTMDNPQRLKDLVADLKPDLLDNAFAKALASELIIGFDEAFKI